MFLLMTASVLLSLIAAYRVYDTRRNQMIADALADGTYFDGTFVDGVEVSGMTYDYALRYFETKVEPKHSGVTVEIDTIPVTSAELGYSSNYELVLAALMRSQRTGSNKAQYQRMQATKESPTYISVSRSYYTEELVDKCVAAYAKRINTGYTAPGVDHFDFETKTFYFYEGATGRKLDSVKLKNDIIACVTTGGGSVTSTVDVVAPEKSASELFTEFGMIASAVTSAASSSSARINNIKLALKSINGTILAPGDEFSFNGTVGQRTAKRGYKKAAAYSSGEVIEEYGGGICQVSTTLFNAAAKSDLEITERHNHSIPVKYVDKGKDATVCWGAQDFRFVNDTEYPVYIIAYLGNDKRVNIEIYGKLLEDGMTIKIEAEVTETVPFEIKKEPNSFLPTGVVQLYKDGRNGYKASAYKLYYSSSGDLVRRELLCKSYYPVQNKVFHYGP